MNFHLSGLKSTWHKLQIFQKWLSQPHLTCLLPAPSTLFFSPSLTTHLLYWSAVLYSLSDLPMLFLLHRVLFPHYLSGGLPGLNVSSSRECRTPLESKLAPVPKILSFRAFLKNFNHMFLWLLPYLSTTSDIAVHLFPSWVPAYSPEWVPDTKLCVYVLSHVRLFVTAGLFHPRDFPGTNAGVGCYFLLQGVFLTQGLNLSFLFLLQRFHKFILKGLKILQNYFPYISFFLWSFFLRDIFTK